MADSEIARYLEEHEELRANGINLVASENCLSRRVREALASDLAGRYGTEDYGGTAYIRKIVTATEALAQRLFGAKHAMVTPLSGNLCVLSAVSALSTPGDAVAMLPFHAGGYPFGIEKFHRRRVDIPADERTLAIDVEEAVKLIVREGVRLVFLGASIIPFPHPVGEFRQSLEDAGHDCLIVYDGSHVLGLIACGSFQDPLREGADILIGSTHKTLYGPQGGLVLTDPTWLADSLRGMLELDLEAGIGLVDNPHLNRIAALGLALEEMLDDPSYGERVIENARSLAAALDEVGFPVRFPERGYTASHQVLLDFEAEDARRLCRGLESAGIFIDAWGRLGTAEVTHRGMGSAEMRGLAGWIGAIYKEGSDYSLKAMVAGLARSFPPP